MLAVVNQHDGAPSSFSDQTGGPSQATNVDNSSVSLADGRQHLCSDWQFPKWTRWRTPVRISSMRYRAAVRSTSVGNGSRRTALEAAT